MIIDLMKNIHLIYVLLEILFFWGEGERETTKANWLEFPMEKHLIFIALISIPSFYHAVVFAFMNNDEAIATNKLSRITLPIYFLISALGPPPFNPNGDNIIPIHIEYRFYRQYPATVTT